MENTSTNKIKGITLAGRLGAGKSSTGDALAEKLGYERFSGGKFFRDEAEERGMTFAELHEFMKKDLSIDEAVDIRQKEFLNTSEGYVIDSRLGHFFAPNAFSVFLEIDEEIAAERMIKDAEQNPDRKSEAHLDTVEEMIKANRARVESNGRRYKELYDVEDHLAVEDFDIVVNTAENSLKEVVQIIVEAYHSWLEE